MKSAQPRKHQTLDTLRLMKLVPNSDQANGSVTRQRTAQQPPPIYKNKEAKKSMFESS